jgi:hypothetical protein
MLHTYPNIGPHFFTLPTVKVYTRFLIGQKEVFTEFGVNVLTMRGARVAAPDAAPPPPPSSQPPLPPSLTRRTALKWQQSPGALLLLLLLLLPAHEVAAQDVTGDGPEGTGGGTRAAVEVTAYFTEFTRVGPYPYQVCEELPGGGFGSGCGV